MTWKIENIGKAIFALLTESETGYRQIDAKGNGKVMAETFADRLLSESA